MSESILPNIDLLQHTIESKHITDIVDEEKNTITAIYRYKIQAMDLAEIDISLLAEQDPAAQDKNVGTILAHAVTEITQDSRPKKILDLTKLTKDELKSVQKLLYV